MIVNRITDYENIHKGQDIYIIGSGKSLDFLDKSFFENKITIGINQTYKFISPNYCIRKEHKFIGNVLEETDEKVIHFVSMGNCGGNDTSKVKNYITNKRVVFFPHFYNRHSLNDLPPDGNIVVSHSTITSGIHLAAYMGAKNIILVGHDGGSINGEANFKGYHTSETMDQKNTEEYKKWLIDITQHTITLKKLLKQKYGCNVVSINPFVNFKLEGNRFTL